MKLKYLTAIILLLCLSGLVAAQEISYIIPDIGAPDMNTYIEIIGPHDQTGNFGDDGLYLNNPGDDVYLELVNPADSTKITFGPLIVSWDGRMISTQIFVHPNVNPNTSDWQNLNAEFIIPFRVVVNGTPTNEVKFYILKPYNLGDVTSYPDRVFGESSLGKRSPRGAIIVDSLILANDVYTVSTNDCDPETEGNQGYLPFILLSKGNISGGSNSKISVSTTNKHGGPGGGGGGGKYCDSPGGDGSDGGDGFTGGGPGGRNKSGNPFSSDNHKPAGTGTGKDSDNERIGGYSLNGIPGANSTAYESAGGGTGHPFGRSGDGCGDGYSCDPEGGYGGGGGAPQNGVGGSAGYVSEGDNTTSNNGGKVYGNRMAVPAAGGSGGASGNPNTPIGNCSGEGGGGGGAIVVYGMNINNLNLSADGSDGFKAKDTDVRSYGGAGSGGFTGFFAKQQIVGAASAIGGESAEDKKASDGRIRIDADDFTAGFGSANETEFRGITSDTTSFVRLTDSIMGSFQSSEFVKIFLKTSSGPWQELSNVDLQGDNWKTFPQFTNDNDLYFLTAVLNMQFFGSSDYTYDQSYVMSQAAANILKLEEYPEILSDTVRRDTIKGCPGNEVYDTLYVKNTGTDWLQVDFQNAVFKNGTPGFELLTPTKSTFVLPDDSLKVVVRYTYQAGQPLTVTDILQFGHNDTEAKKDPWEIRYEIKVEPFLLSYIETSTGKALGAKFRDSTLFLGSQCPGVMTYAYFTVKNNSSFEVNLKDPVVNNSKFSADITGKRTIPSNDTSTVRVEFNGNSDDNQIISYLIIQYEDCDAINDTISITVNIKHTDIEIIGSGDFGNVRVGDTKQIKIELENKSSNNTAYIDDIPTIVQPSAFTIVDFEPDIPLYLMPGESMTFTVEFAPQTAGPDSTLYEAFSALMDTSCADTTDIMLKGNAVQFNTVVYPKPLDFGYQPFCKKPQDSIIIKNMGTGDIEITGKLVITGSDAASFETSQNVDPQIIPVGDSLIIYIRFYGDRGNFGQKTAFIEIPTNDPDKDLIKVQLLAYKEDIIMDPTEISLGGIPVGILTNSSFTLTNNGHIIWDVDDNNTSHNDLSVTPPGAKLDSLGGSFVFNLAITPTRTGPQTDTIIFETTDPCIDTFHVLVHWRGLEAQISATDTLNYGLIASCSQKLDSILVKNFGEASAEIKDMRITGFDAALFSIVNPKYPTTLSPGDSIYQPIMFNPSSADDGPKTAVCNIDVTMNSQDISFQTVLKGEKQSVILTYPNPIDFGTISVGNSKDMRLTLKNDGDFPAHITGMTALAQPSIFSMNPDQIDVILQKGDSITFDVSFSPAQEIPYEDSVTYSIDIDTCTEQRTVQLRGRGAPAAFVEVWLPDTLVKPNIRHYQLPVFAQKDVPDVEIKDISFTGKFKFDASLFYPEGLSKGQIIGNELDPQTRTRTIEIKVDSVEIFDRKTILTRIEGSTLLGEVDRTGLIWEEFNWDNNSTFQDSVLDGSLRIIICREGGDRLLKWNYPIDLSVYPLPAGEELNVDARILESGKHSLELIDIHGREIDIHSWNADTGGKVYEFTFDTGGLSSGVYYLRLSSTSKNKVVPVYITK